MDVYYADEPFNHHYFIKTVNNDHRDASLLRVDNHLDYTGEIPCSRYVSKIKYFFRNVIWLNKPSTDMFTIDVDRRAFPDMASGFEFFESLGEVIDHLSSVLMDKVVIDIDPDVINNYFETTTNYSRKFDTGMMSLDELRSVIKHVYSNYDVLYLFFAAPKEFAEQSINELIKEPNFIHLDQRSYGDENLNTSLSLTH